MPKVSVIIPVYNVEQYIRECLESVLFQTLSDIEILVVNDGTKDRSIEVIEDLIAGDERIRLINKKNGGLSSARNAGLVTASGEYVLFLDSDDYLDKTALAILYTYAKENNIEELFYNAESFFEEKAEEENGNYKTYYNRNGRYSEVLTGQELFVKFVNNKDYKPSACLQLVKTEFLAENGISFYEGILHEDNLFTLQCLLMAKRAAFLDEKLYKRRVHLESIMTSPKGMRNSYGYYITVYEMLKTIEYYTGDLDEQYKETIEQQLKSLLVSSRKYVESVTQSDLEIFINTMDLEHRIVYKLLVADEVQKKQVAAKISNTIDHLKNDKKGPTIQKTDPEKEKYIEKIDKAMRIITFLPRKTIGGIRCYQEHGLRYTLHRIKYKFSRLLKKCSAVVEKKRLADEILVMDTEKIAVSFILPVYNVEPYLPECLDSILNQTMQNFEIICVDDGSTDNSLKILKDYAARDKRIQVFTQENKFAGIARNHGMKYATGEYLLFLDSDDFVEPDLMEKVYRKAKLDKADVCLFGARKYDNVTKEYTAMPWILRENILPKETPFSAKEQAERVYAFTSPCPWSKLFRREFAVANKLEFMALKRTNDLFFVEAALSIADRISYCTGGYVNYRCNTGTNLQANNQETPTDFYKALVQLKQFLENREIYKLFKKGYENLALSTCIYNWKSLKTEEKRAELQNQFKKEIFPELGLTALLEDRILPYNKQNYNDYVMIYSEKS